MKVLGPRLSRWLRAWSPAEDAPAWRHAAWRLLWIVLGSKRLLIDYAGGGLLTVDPRAPRDAAILRHGSVELDAWQSVLKFFRNDDCFWDIGAGQGEIAIRAGLDRRIARIVPIETDPAAGAHLASHLAMNLGAFEAIPDATGLTLTVDRWIYERGLPPPTILRLNCDDALDALKGAQRLLHDAPPRALLLRSAVEDTTSGARSFLASCGYSFERVCDAFEGPEQGAWFLASRQVASAAADTLRDVSLRRAA